MGSQNLPPLSGGPGRGRTTPSLQSKARARMSLNELGGHFLMSPGNDLRAHFSYDATTVVVMPPRAVKAPVTVMRRGEQAATRSSRIWLVAAS